MLTSGEPLEQVITPLGPFMASRKMAMKHEPNTKLRRSINLHFLLVFSIKNARSYPASETKFSSVSQDRTSRFTD